MKDWIKLFLRSLAVLILNDFFLKMRSGLEMSTLAEFCSSLKSYIHVSAVGEVYFPAESCVVWHYIAWRLAPVCSVDIEKNYFSDSCSAIPVREFHYLHLASREVISDRMESSENVEFPQRCYLLLRQFWYRSWKIPFCLCVHWLIDYSLGAPSLVLSFCLLGLLASHC